MGVLFIIVRNFPWWAIPVGLVLIIESFRKDHNGKAKSGKKKFLLVLTGILLIGTSVSFLYLKGHESAVPVTHEIFKEVFRR